MVNERPNQFGGVNRFAGGRPGIGRPPASSAAGPSSQSRVGQVGLGLGKGAAGLGKGKTLKRHMKIRHDTIHGVTKGDIRRLARRGGIKRISATVYDDIRQVMKSRLQLILKEAIAVMECTGRKTISVRDIIFILNRQGRPIYGFDPDFVKR